jgi:hypothetical protein
MKDLPKLKSEIADVLKGGYFPHDTKVLVDKIDKSIQDKDSEALSKNTLDLWRNMETEYFIALMESVDEKYRGIVKELAIAIYQENNIKSELEKTLVEVCVGSFIRYLDNSQRLNNELNGRNITPNRNQYIANLSKQVDRSHRQYIQTLITLKQFKNPSVELKINATNAFLSNNQQVNIKEDEIIKPI